MGNLEIMGRQHSTYDIWVGGGQLCLCISPVGILLK